MAKPKESGGLQTGPSVTVYHMPTHIVMYSIGDSDLDMLCASDSGTSGLFVGLAFGTAVTSLTTLLTVPIASEKVFAGFVAALIVSAVGTLFFGIRCVVDFRRNQRKKEQIKRRPVPIEMSPTDTREPL